MQGVLCRSYAFSCSLPALLAAAFSLEQAARCSSARVQALQKRRERWLLCPVLHVDDDSAKRLSSSSPRTSPRFAQCCSLQPECSLKHSARTNRRALARAGLSLVIARKGHDASAETLLRVQPRAAHKLSYCHLHSAERLRAVREVHLPSFASTECDKK